MIGSFLNFKNIDKKITPKRALTNKIKKILVSEDISLMDSILTSNYTHT
jgi:hypothetical protein